METLSSRQVYENPWMTVREDTFRRPDGSEGIFGVVDKPAYALVIALDGTGPSARVMLVEQFRYPVGRRSWEFPQGTAPDRDEMEPAALAARELREETGLRAGRWEPLGLLHIAPGLSSQRGQAYLATDLTQGEPEREETEADMRTAWVTRAEFEDMVRSGDVTDAQSIAAYGLLLLAGH
ncbi:NUDIX domain-containing protein [Actinomycetospora sp. TBRC 11914]|uniref:NUDIX domain-containing protein n=1 Tax=Actinomycetospora sp. TBRC 11914 TaxID=2729387 RepID=UPI0037C1AB64